MNTPDKTPVPPDGMELLPAEFLREHRAQEGMKYKFRENTAREEWDEWEIEWRQKDGKMFESHLELFLFIAPIGTMARVLAEKGIVKNAVTCGICHSPADRHPHMFICQANAGHVGDLNGGIFTDLNPPSLSHPSAGDGEATISQKGGDEPCTQTLTPASSVVEVADSNQTNASASNAAPVVQSDEVAASRASDELDRALAIQRIQRRKASGGCRNLDASEEEIAKELVPPVPENGAGTGTPRLEWTPDEYREVMSKASPLPWFHLNPRGGYSIYKDSETKTPLGSFTSEANCDLAIAAVNALPLLLEIEAHRNSLEPRLAESEARVKEQDGHIEKLRNRLREHSKMSSEAREELAITKDALTASETARQLAEADAAQMREAVEKAMSAHVERCPICAGQDDGCHVGQLLEQALSTTSGSELLRERDEAKRFILALQLIFTKFGIKYETAGDVEDGITTLRTRLEAAEAQIVEYKKMSVKDSFQKSEMRTALNAANDKAKAADALAKALQGALDATPDDVWLKFDDDPHPPSSLRVEAEAALAALAAHCANGGGL